jgi:hypothetical protein
MAVRRSKHQAGHVGGGAEFVEENELIQPHVGELREPVGTCLFDVGAILLGGVPGLF